MRWLAVLLITAACEKATPPAPCVDVATCRSRCTTDDPKSCNQLGKLLLRAKPVDLPGAADAYSRSCDGGYLSACAALALQVQDGRGVPWDRARAVQLYQRACDGGAGIGCFNLAIMYNEGNGVPADRAKAEAMMARALELYDKQCRTEPLWCANIAFLYEEGMVGSGGPDLVKAAAADRRGCDLGDPDACASFARLELAGDGVPQDIPGATAKLHKLCAADDALACALAADPRLHGDKAGPVDMALLIKACDLGNAEACSQASGRYALGRGVPADAAKAGEYGVRACDLGSSVSCMAHGEEIEAAHPDQARDFYVRACHIGLDDGCRRAGVQH